MCTLLCGLADLLKVRAQAIDPATRKPFYHYPHPWKALGDIYRNEGGFAALYRCEHVVYIGKHKLRRAGRVTVRERLCCRGHEPALQAAVPLAHAEAVRHVGVVAGVSCPPLSVQ